MKSVLGSVLCGIALSMLGMMALGIPGAALASVAMPLIQMIWPSPRAFPSDSAWPFAILVTMAWGVAVPPVWLLTRGLRGFRRFMVVCLGMLVAGVAISVVLYGLQIAPMLP